ncbi:MAG: hypothetical protein KDA24_11795 [Deltaproteobacteria bacterium]|nr:hypothetical protein [Deltaproteobacteria bacterium]
MTRFAPILFTLLLAPGLAQGAPPAENPDTTEEEPRVIYDQRQEVEMDDLRVDSQVSKPHGAGVVARRVRSWKPLLDLRANFDAEIVGSVQSIR